jgi:hypothetical protein
MNAATTYLQANVPNREETREFLGQSVGFKNELISQSNSPARHRRGVSPRVVDAFLTTGSPEALTKFRVLEFRAFEFVPGPTASGPEYAVNAPLCARRKEGQRPAQPLVERYFEPGGDAWERLRWGPLGKQPLTVFRRKEHPSPNILAFSRWFDVFIEIGPHDLGLRKRQSDGYQVDQAT